MQAVRPDSGHVRGKVFHMRSTALWLQEVRFLARSGVDDGLFGKCKDERRGPCNCDGRGACAKYHGKFSKEGACLNRALPGKACDACVMRRMWLESGEDADGGEQEAGSIPNPLGIKSQAAKYTSEKMREYPVRWRCR